MAGQTINDRLLAARHSLAGQGLAKSVCKATTEEMIGPKKKHLDYLVHCTNEPNVSIPHLANLLIERSQNANWVVVYKALLTVHHLLAYGNERFMQYLASSNSTFNLSNFLDKGGVQGTVGARIGYDMSPFIRRYAKYLNDKALSYRTVAFDFCKVKRGKEEGSLRTMNADKLLKTLPVLQAQLDGLLEFDCQSNDLSNGVINMCFMLLFRDLIRLFACYNDGIINLLEKYFDMNKKQCRDALDLYKRFLVRMDRVGEFLKVAENVGIDKGDIPDLTKAPSSLLDALEGHLASLEGKKGSAANTPTQTSSNQKNVKSGVSALSSTSSSFGTAAASAKFDVPENGIDDAIKAQALAEEEAAMNQYKSKLTSPTAGGGAGAVTNPFLSSPTDSDANIAQMFGGGMSSGPITNNGSAFKASDDLLQLGNPFADVFTSPNGATMDKNGIGILATDLHLTETTGMWADTNGSSIPASNQPNNTFVSDTNFSSVFGATEPTGFDALGDVLKPGPASGQSGQQMMNPAQAQHINQSPLMRQNPQAMSANPPGKILTGDLDSSLASLAENLSINKGSSGPKGMQWNSPKNTAKQGSAGWTPQPMAATTGAGYRPMAQGTTICPSPSTLHHPYVHTSYPAISPFYQQQNVPPMRPAQPPMMTGVGMPQTMPMGGAQSGGVVPLVPGAGQMTNTNMSTQSMLSEQQNGKANSVQLDPFGAI